MTCASCPQPLTEADRRRHYVRCLRCRQTKPGRATRIEVRRTAKPRHAYPGWTIRAPKVKAQPKVSWWTQYAVGERRDAEFQAKAESLVPKPTDPMRLQEWIA